jgi:hypothetical protein
MKSSLETIRTESLLGITMAIDCGELPELACLCDENTRRIYETMLQRFTAYERYLIFRKYCACRAPAPQPTVSATPAVHVPEPVQAQPSPAPAPAETGQPVACPESPPPAGTYTGAVANA